MNVLVHQFNMYDLRLDEAQEIHSQLQNTFPDMKIVSLPSTSSLCIMDVEELKEIGNWILNLVEEIENND